MATPGIKRAWRTLRVPPPAAGTDWEIVPGGQRWWRVVSFVAVLNTSAVVGARQVVLEATSGAHVWLRLPTQASQAASTSVFYTGHTAAPRDGTTVNTLTVPLPGQGLLLGPGDRFRPVTSSLDAGDTWTDIVAKLEEIPSGLEYEGDQLYRPAESIGA